MTIIGIDISHYAYISQPIDNKNRHSFDEYDFEISHIVVKFPAKIPILGWDVYHTSVSLLLSLATLRCTS